MVSQSQISRYLSGEYPLPVTFVMALKEDERTRPLAIAIMRYMGGFTVQVRENPSGTTDGEPVSHDLIEMDVSKAAFIKAISERRPAAATKALDELDKHIWALRLKSQNGNLKKVK